MRWPWRRHEQDLPVTDDIEDAVSAREGAEEKLLEARAKSKEVKKTVDSLKRHERINHFSRLWGETLGGGT